MREHQTKQSSLYPLAEDGKRRRQVSLSGDQTFGGTTEKALSCVANSTLSQKTGVPEAGP